MAKDPEPSRNNEAEAIQQVIPDLRQQKDRPGLLSSFENILPPPYKSNTTLEQEVSNSVQPQSGEDMTEKPKEPFNTLSNTQDQLVDKLDESSEVKATEVLDEQPSPYSLVQSLIDMVQSASEKESLEVTQSSEPTTNQSLETVSSEDDNISVISSYADSVFSVESLVSAGTDFSRNSGFTTDEIMTATKKLIVIFQDDTVLKPLYLHALADPAIGPTKLERNLRRLFKQCAYDLEKEAKDRIEYLGARLVSYQARSLAKSVVSRFGDSNPQPVVGDLKVESEESSDEEEQGKTFDDSVFEDLAVFSTFLVESGAFQQLRENVEKFASSKKSQSKVDKPASTAITELDEHPISKDEPGLMDEQEARTTRFIGKYASDKNRFEALLGGSLNCAMPIDDDSFSYTTPVGMFRDTEPRWRRARAHSSERNAPSSGVKFECSRRRSVGVLDVKNEFSMPVFSSQTTRSTSYRRIVQLRWQCVSTLLSMNSSRLIKTQRCARTFVCNVVELREKGVEDLVARMQRSIGSKVTVTPVSPTNSKGGTTSFQQLQLQLRNMILKLASGFKKQTSQGSLPQHNGTPTVSTAPIPNSSTPQQRMLHLLACMRAGRFRTSLSQDRVEDIKSDHELFIFMRKNFASHRGRIRRFLSINGVKRIFFVKLRVPSSELIQPSLVLTCVIFYLFDRFVQMAASKYGAAIQHATHRHARASPQ